MRMTPDSDESVRCTTSGCNCVFFKPGSVQIRSCDHCGHGWVAHAMEKLLPFQARQPSSCGPVEVALPGLVFHLSALVLYGAQAVPVRLKILLDRLYSILPPEQVGHILNTLGWSSGDYVRGYMLQLPGGKVLDHWVMVTPEEELLIFKQFLRFGETRPVVQLMTRKGLAAVSHLPHTERSPAPKSCQSNELLPACKLTRCQQKSNRLERRGREGGGRGEREKDPILQKLKADPDKLNPAPPMWRQDPRFNKGGFNPLHRGVATQENTSSLSSSSLHLSISSSPSSPPKIYQKLQSSPSYSLSSSSFICPLPSSPFPSSLHPLPSSLCSLPPLAHAGGRKGRVCCGICGKSFYDKGTLKIHYNAVHLKIKHRCTVAGCTMVFSSLRSRNRHSANPNPRLHACASRDAHTHSHLHTNPHAEPQIPKDRNGCENIHNSDTRVCREAEIHNTRVHTLINGFNGNATSRQETTPPQADSPPTSPHSLPSTLSQGFTLRDSTSDLHPQATPPPPLVRASASSLGSPRSLVPLALPAVENPKRGRRLLNLHTKQVAPASLLCPDPNEAPGSDSQPASHDYCVTNGKQGEAGTSPPTSQQQQWETLEPMPKKRPRKSSMPVKIEIEKVAN